VGLLMILPLISLLAHISTSNWIYNVRWYPANISPLLLGLAVAIGASDWRVSTMRRRMQLQFWLPVLAMALSAKFPSALVFSVTHVGFSPLRLAMLATMLVYLHGFVLHRHFIFAWAACALLGAAGIGMSVRQILDSLSLYGGQSFDTLKKLWPRTMTHWGFVSLAASFALLILGAMVSLRKPMQVEVVEDREC
jgi:hypothetical protein